MSKIKNWSTDKIIGAGLILVLLILVLGNIITLVFNVIDFTAFNVAANIATGLIGYMKGSSDKQKKEDESK